MSDWSRYGGELKRFEFNGKACEVVVPEKPAEGRPWVWRGEFFEAFNQADLELLRRGWHLAYTALCDRYGCPSAVEDMKRFHDRVVSEFALAPRAALFGFSRGGLYCVNYALAYPEDAACLYLDAPVCDIRSWPGGKGAGEGAPGCWRECLRCYGLTEAESVSFKGSPLDRAEELAEKQIPLLVVAGDADRTVPYAENGRPLAARYAAAGGRALTLIVKPGCDHHPHSLEDPEPIVRFVLEHR